MRSVRVLWVVPLLALLQLGCGDSGKKKDNVDEPEVAYAVSGSIKDGAGDGLAGVRIDFEKNGFVTSAADGSWSKDGLLGTVILTPSLDGYVFSPASRQVSGAADDIAFIGNHEADTYEISGRVEDSMGLPAGGVKIELDGSQIAGPITITSATDGTWSQGGLAGAVKVSPKGVDTTFIPSFVDVAGATTDIVFVARPKEIDTFAASGVVTDGKGAGIGGVSLDFGDFGSTLTGADGSWSREGLRGAVTITPSLANYTFAPASYEVSAAEADISFVGQLIRAPLVLQVGAGQEYASVQAAIDAAFDGDTVEVHPGTYQENLTLDCKLIELRSTDPTSLTVINATILEGELEIYCVEFGTVAVRGLTIRGGIVAAPDDGDGGNAPLDLTLENNVFIDTTYGYALRTKSRRLIFRNNRVVGPYLEGLVAEGGKDTLIADNRFEGTRRSGIHIFGGVERLTVTGNAFRENKALGFNILDVAAGHSVYIYNNDASLNEAGGGYLSIDGGDVDVIGNTFGSNVNGSWGGAGLHMDGTAFGNVVVDGNSFDRNVSTGNGGGLSVKCETGDVRLINNLFYSNVSDKLGSGVAVYPPCMLIDDDEERLDEVKDGRDSGGNTYDSNDLVYIGS